MIVEEFKDNGVLHYSDAEMMIRQVETGNLYVDAYDILPCPYTYEETDQPINPPEPEPFNG